VFNRTFALVFILFCTLVSHAQEEVRIVGRFRTDSVKLGEPIEYYVTAKYPSQWQVLLPDSTFSFTPFDFQKKVYYPTHTSNNISTDSVLYVLNTFEIDSIQTLKVPAFVVVPGDCTRYESNVDTVFFKHLVSQLPDSLSAEQLPLKTNTAYNAVSWLFNYPVFSIVIGSLIFIAFLVWVIFGKKIKKHFLLKRLSKNHHEFMLNFDFAIEKLKSGFTPESAEQSVIIWKKYMEDLVTKPYTKSTTRELKEIENNETLVGALRVIDRSIYGRIPPDTLDSFLNLKEFSQSQFNKKLEELRHG
jgi:hypothetical protein